MLSQVKESNALRIVNTIASVSCLSVFLRAAPAFMPLIQRIKVLLLLQIIIGALFLGPHRLLGVVIMLIWSSGKLLRRHANIVARSSLTLQSWSAVVLVLRLLDQVPFVAGTRASYPGGAE